MRRGRIGVRTRLLIAVVGAVALGLVVAVAAFSFLLAERMSSSATTLAKAQAAATASSLEIRGGALAVPEGPNDGALGGQVWIFAGPRLLERPRASARVDAAARSLAGGPERSLDVGEETRLYALPIVVDGVRYGTAVSAISLDPYGETERTALIAFVILAVLVLGAVALLSRWMLGRALLPVSRMTADAASWSEHDLDRRFDLGEPYDELTRLSWTLDNLLERIAATLRHEQRFTAELSHELRTPLARAKGQTELALRRERTSDEYRSALEAVDRNVDQMTRTVDTLVAAARQEAGLTISTSDARDAVRAAVESSRAIDPRVELHLALPPEPARVAVETELIERMLQPLLENAVRYGRSKVDVALVRNGAAALVHVADDGPGVSEAEQAAIFDPGIRGDAARNRTDGAGLGLALARRVARSAGGEITVTASGDGGRFTLRIPLAR